MTGKVLITDHTWPDIDLERTVLQAAGLQVMDAPASDEATLASLAGDSDAILTCFAQVTPSVIDSALNLKVIARYGVGVDNIAVQVATDRRIPVTYVPDYCVAEVSEHALALLLALARGVVRYNRSVTQGDWNLGVAAPLRRIEGQTLGLVGCGRIGRRLAEKALGPWHKGPRSRCRHGRGQRRHRRRVARRQPRCAVGRSGLRKPASATDPCYPRLCRRIGPATDETNSILDQYRTWRSGRHSRPGASAARRLDRGGCAGRAATGASRCG